jgi:CelD/BcsL family acetyltransferase involved in cellulose biosynthesis
MEVVELNNIEHLAPYRQVWHALLAKTPHATFFQSLEWLEAWWKHFGRDHRLRTIVVSQHGHVVGILPLVVSPERTRLGTLHLLGWPLDGWGSFYGPIGGFTEPVLDAAFGHIRRTRRDWDVLDLRWIRADEGDWILLENALRNSGIEVESEPFEHLAMIHLGGTWEEYWRQFKSHERQNVQRGLRRLEKMGTIEFVRHRPTGQGGDDDPRWDLFEGCQRVAERSWQGNAEDGTTLSNAPLRQFYRDTHAAAARAGALDLGLIQLDGKPIAFAYNYHTRGYVYVIKMGFDPELAKTGVGKLILSRLIEDSYRRGDRTIDLGPESFHYKRIWLTAVETSYRCTYYAATSPRAQSLRWARWAKSLVRRQPAESADPLEPASSESPS